MNRYLKCEIRVIYLIHIILSRYTGMGVPTVLHRLAFFFFSLSLSVILYSLVVSKLGAIWQNIEGQSMKLCTDKTKGVERMTGDSHFSRGCGQESSTKVQ